MYTLVYIHIKDRTLGTVQEVTVQEVTVQEVTGHHCQETLLYSDTQRRFHAGED